MIALLVAWVGCGPAPGDEEPEPEPEPAVAFAPPPVPTVAARAAGEPVVVHLEYFGVGRLYQGFFGDRAAVDALGAALGTCLTQEAWVRVSYDEETRVGRIVLRVEPGASACLPVADGEGWDLAPLVPLGLALADYRDRLASTYDLRLASFQVGLAVRGGAEVCTLWAAGTHPPDGRAFSTCVEVRGGAPCGPGAADGVTRLEPAGAERRRLRECFSGG